MTTLGGWEIFHESLRKAGFSLTTRNPSIVQLELNLDLILDQANRPSLLREGANNGEPLGSKQCCITAIAKETRTLLNTSMADDRRVCLYRLARSR